MTQAPAFYLGAARPLDGKGDNAAYHLPPHHLATHGVVLGMTGSGKTGLVTVLVEEALRTGIPVLMIDVKGDLPNLLLSFPSLGPAAFEPWVEGTVSPNDPRSVSEIAADLANQRARGLKAWSIGEPQLVDYARTTALRVITPGSSSGELLHVLSSLECLRPLGGRPRVRPRRTQRRRLPAAASARSRSRPRQEQGPRLTVCAR